VCACLCVGMVVWACKSKRVHVRAACARQVVEYMRMRNGKEMGRITRPLVSSDFAKLPEVDAVRHDEERMGGGVRGACRSARVGRVCKCACRPAAHLSVSLHRKRCLRLPRKVCSEPIGWMCVTESAPCVQAANYLGVPSLMDLVCAYIASLVRFKKATTIRATFNLRNDFAPGEEAELVAETVWARVPRAPAASADTEAAAAITGRLAVPAQRAP